MGEGLSDVFSFYINQLSKAIDVLKEIPVFFGISLFHTLLALALISIFIRLIKYRLTHINATDTLKSVSHKTHDRAKRGEDY